MSTFKEAVEKRIGVESDYPYTFQGGAFFAAELIWKEMLLEMDRMNASTKSIEECEHMKWVFEYIRKITSYIGVYEP